jgi:hypothetical protein
VTMSIDRSVSNTSKILITLRWLARYSSRISLRTFYRLRSSLI